MQSSSARASLQKMRAPRYSRDAGDHATLQRAIDVDRSAGDDLGARCDPADYRHVAFGMQDRLAGANVGVDDQRSRGWRLLRAGGRGRIFLRHGQRARRPPTGHPWRKFGPDQSAARVLYRHDADVA